MRRCSHYLCSEPAYDTDEPGFYFCAEHLTELRKLMEYDSYYNLEFKTTLHYILAAINHKPEIEVIVQ